VNFYFEGGWGGAEDLQNELQATPDRPATRPVHIPSIWRIITCGCAIVVFGRRGVEGPLEDQVSSKNFFA